jgi:type IV secretory pathway TrbF-like protein
MFQKRIEAMFRRPTVHYGKSLEPVTPYQRAAQVWDERIGSARVQAKNWRLAFFGTLALSGGLAAGLVWQGARGTIVPWVVQVDRLGEAQAVARGCHLSADRSADRLSSGPLHRAGARHSRRSDHRAAELAARL